MREQQCNVFYGNKLKALIAVSYILQIVNKS